MLKMGAVMNNAKYLWGGVLLCLLTLGMGSMGNEEAARLPDVDQNYAVTLVDQSDVSMALESFSADGQTFLTGRFGKARISIGFEKIRSAGFMMAGSELTAKIALKNGEALAIVMDGQKPFFGRASFANVRIEARDIKTIEFKGKVK